MTALLAARRRTLRAFGAAVTPETAHLSEDAWLQVEATMERALAQRPARVQRQIVLLLKILEQLPRVRYGRAFSALSADERARFVAMLERAPVMLVRRGIWGLRTLVFMGHYTRPETMQALGYAADRRGWAARARADVHVTQAPPVQ